MEVKIIAEIHGWQKEVTIDFALYERGRFEMGLSRPISFLTPGNEGHLVVMLIRTGKYVRGLPVFEYAEG